MKACSWKGTPRIAGCVVQRCILLAVCQLQVSLGAQQILEDLQPNDGTLVGQMSDSCQTVRQWAALAVRQLELSSGAQRILEDLQCHDYARVRLSDGVGTRVRQLQSAQMPLCSAAQRFDQN